MRFDLLVESCVLVEAKGVEKVLAIHKAQIYAHFSRSAFNAPPQAMTWSNIALTDFS